MTPIQHQRTATYDGERLGFKFPSEEDLDQLKEQPVVLSGPQVQPYYQYESGASVSSHASSSGYSFDSYGCSQVEEYTDYCNKYDNYIYGEDYYNDIISFYSDDAQQQVAQEAQEAQPEAQPQTVAQQDVADVAQHAEQPRHKTMVEAVLGQPEPVETNSHPLPAIPQQIRENQLSRSPSVIISPLAKREVSRTASARSNFLSTHTKRTSSVRNLARFPSEDSSLYRKSSLKRSKAIKYKVGWLTNLRTKFSKWSSKFNNWRIVTKKKVSSFKFKSKTFRLSRFKSSRHYKISAPLEKVRSISELKREVDNELYGPNLDLEDQESIPFYEYIPSSSSSRDVLVTRSAVPPPLPPHRIASTPALKLILDAEKEKEDQQVQDNSQPLSHDDDDVASQDSFNTFEQLFQDHWNKYLTEAIVRRVECNLDYYQSVTGTPYDSDSGAIEVYANEADNTENDLESLYSESQFSESPTLTSSKSSTSDFSVVEAEVSQQQQKDEQEQDNVSVVSVTIPRRNPYRHTTNISTTQLVEPKSFTYNIQPKIIGVHRSSTLPTNSCRTAFSALRREMEHNKIQSMLRPII